MATLKYKDIQKMNKANLEKKMKELKLELVKSKANAAKTGAKTKEIKKIIARIHTFNNTENKSGLKEKSLTSSSKN